MSTTIPFTLIEGAMALPSLRPLGQISRSFGREWSLLPPNVSFRVELKALYAAVLRTFCLSSDAIRSMCKWEPRRKPPEAAATNPLPPGAIAHSVPMPAHAPRGPQRQSNLLAGGAWAVGGAAMLAWIVLDHLPRNGVDTRAPAADLPVKPRTQLMEPARPGSSGGNKPGIVAASNAEPAAAARVAEATRRTRDEHSRTQTGTPDFRVGASTARAVIPATASISHASTSRALARDGARRSGPATRIGRTAASPIEPTGSRTASIASKQPFASVPTAHRTRATPSTAGDYSPFAPSSVENGEYASIAMSARTHGGVIAPAQRSASSTDKDSTAWMEHMSQRRVTEVPERFSK